MVEKKAKKVKKQERKKIIIIGIIILAIVLFIFLYPSLTGKSINIFSKSSSKGAGTTGTGKSVQVQLSKDNFHLFLGQQQVVRDLPDNAIISLRLYNFDKGIREWEKSYVISKGSVKEGTTGNADIEIIIHSKYIFDAARDLCSAVKKAKANNDFGADLKISTASFLWKYRGMMGYKSCFGY